MLPRVNMNLSEGETIIFQGHPLARDLGFYLKASSSRSSSGSSPSWSPAPRRSSSSCSCLAVTLLIGFIKRWRDDVIDHHPPPQHQTRDHLARDPGTGWAVQNVNYNQSVLPADHAHRRRRFDTWRRA